MVSHSIFAVWELYLAELSKDSVIWVHVYVVNKSDRGVSPPLPMQWLKGVYLHISLLLEFFEELGPQNQDLFASLI